MDYDHTERTIVNVSTIKASCFAKQCYGGIKTQNLLATTRATNTSLDECCKLRVILQERSG